MLIQSDSGISGNVWLLINSLATTILAAIVAYFARKTKNKEDHEKEVSERLAKIDTQIAVLGTQVSPLWSAVQNNIAKDLTHPSPQFAEMDDLLRKLTALQITTAERIRLHALLIERSETKDPEVTTEEKIKARLFIDVMDLVVIEKAEAKAEAVTAMELKR